MDRGSVHRTRDLHDRARGGQARAGPSRPPGCAGPPGSGAPRPCPRILARRPAPPTHSSHLPQPESVFLVPFLKNEDELVEKVLLVLPFLNESESLVAAILLCKLLKRGPGKESVAKALLGAGCWAPGAGHQAPAEPGRRAAPSPRPAAGGPAGWGWGVGIRGAGWVNGSWGP